MIAKKLSKFFKPYAAPKKMTKTSNYYIMKWKNRDKLMNDPEPLACDKILAIKTILTDNSVDFCITSPPTRIPDHIVSETRNISCTHWVI